MSSKNKIALVTGAGQGLGRGIAKALASQGYDLVISDINQKILEEVGAEIKLLGVKVKVVVGDVSNRQAVEAIFKETVAEFGSLDVLVNNAGIYPFVSFAEMTEEQWDKVMSVNLKSLFLCSQAAIKIMPNGGRIINISSIASIIGFSGLVHYCASKGGADSMTRALALELAQRQITVNGIAPGGIITPGASQGMNDETKRQTIAMVPLGRFGEAEDIAAAVLFLASAGASYITGQTIVVDGGWTLR